jgi:cytoskeletal protein CcmA (bactofilin family)
MALWKDAIPAPSPTAATPAMPSTPSPVAINSAANPKELLEMKESLISAGLSIEGKIIGRGHVRLAGKLKGDVQVEGNLHIDSGARLEGQVRANEVIVSGELHGNIESARRVELQQGGVITGDVKAGQLTVAAGARMRGAVECGWEENGKAASLVAEGRTSGS